MFSQTLYFALGAYLLGAVPFGKIIAGMAAQIDITQRGSKNIGATNVARELGLKWGLLTLALDVLKGLFPILVFSACSFNNFSPFINNLSRTKKLLPISTYGGSATGKKQVILRDIIIVIDYSNISYPNTRGQHEMKTGKFEYLRLPWLISCPTAGES